MKNHIKKIVFLVIFILTLGSIFTGCSGKEEKDEIIVTFMTWESEAMNQKLLASFADFEAANPGIKVELVPSPLQDYGLKLQQMLTAEEAPDIFQIGNDVAQQNGKLGLLYDWSKLAPKDFLNGFYPGVIESWKDGNKLYGLPGLLNCYGIYYNKLMFESAGLQLPKIGWTLTDMITAAKTLKTGDTAGLYYPPYAGVDPFFLSPYAVSMGGKPFADGITNVTMVTADTTFKKVMKMVATAIQAGDIMDPVYQPEGLESLFMQGKIPMMQHGQWVTDALIREAPADLEWGFAPTPVVNSQSVIYDCVGWASPSNIENAEAVFKVLRYLDTKSYEIVLPETPVAPPAYSDSAKPYYDKLSSSGHSDVASTLDYMLNSPNKQPVRFMEGWAGKAKRFIEAEWNKILTGELPIDTIDNIVANINDVIE